MGKNFKRFKRKTRRDVIISSVLIGLGAGLIATAVMLVISRLTGKDFLPLYYAISGATSIIVATALYFVFMPNDVRLARHIDNTYSLGEKVSTMIEFRDSDGDFIKLQREDADEKLGEKPIKLFKSKQLVAALLVFVISAGCVAGAWFVPAKAEETEQPISDFDKEWLTTALKELIAMVDDSFMADALKAEVLGELNSLLEFVEASQLMSEMKAKAITTINSVDTMLKSANTADAIGKQFQTSSNEHIIKLGKELSNLTGTGAKKALDNLADSLKDGDSSDLSFAADEMNVYLNNSGVASDDTIMVAFRTLTAKLRAGDSPKDICKDTGKQISNEIIVQNVNRSTVEQVVSTLCNLFGISKSELSPDISTLPEDGDRDPDDKTPDDDNEVKEPEGSLGSGGLGTGEVIYGSNDMVFDPDSNKYVPYGQLLNDYFAKANEQITDGRTSDKITDAAEEYFGILFGGSDKTSN